MRRPIQTLFVAALALCASAGAALASRPGAMTVDLNESRRVTLAGAAATVVVGDPSVADVAMVDAHSVIVIGRGYGSTQLIVTDRKGHTLLASQVTVVSPNNGRVTLTRGLESTEFNCAGARCHPIADAKVSSGGSPGADGAVVGGGSSTGAVGANTGESGAAAAAGAPAPGRP
jgi:Flp pilus assembly secretin CpaC